MMIEDKYEINLEVDWETAIKIINNFTETQELALRLNKPNIEAIVTDLCAQRGDDIRKRKNLPGSNTAEKKEELEELRKDIREEIMSG